MLSTAERSSGSSLSSAVLGGTDWRGVEALASHMETGLSGATKAGPDVPRSWKRVTTRENRGGSPLRRDEALFSRENLRQISLPLELRKGHPQPSLETPSSSHDIPASTQEEHLATAYIREAPFQPRSSSLWFHSPPNFVERVWLSLGVSENT